MKQDLEPLLKQLEAAYANARARVADLKARLNIGVLEMYCNRIVADGPRGEIFVAIKSPNSPPGKTAVGFIYASAARDQDLLEFRCEDAGLLKKLDENDARPADKRLRNYRFITKREFMGIQVRYLDGEIEAVRETLERLREAAKPGASALQSTTADRLVEALGVQS